MLRITHEYFNLVIIPMLVSHFDKAMITLLECWHVHVCCVVLFRVLMLTVGHDSTPRCMCMLCMTVSRSDCLQWVMTAKVCVCV